MGDTKISFRISSEKKGSLVKAATESELTLTEYILFIFDMYEESNSLSMVHSVAQKSDTNTTQTIEGSETKFRAEFEKEISNAYLRGYQYGTRDLIRKKH